MHLANSNIWHMDDTVIRTPLDDSAISFVYAFMTNKSEPSYTELLNIN